MTFLLYSFLLYLWMSDPGVPDFCMSRLEVLMV